MTAPGFSKFEHPAPAACDRKKNQTSPSPSSESVSRNFNPRGGSIYLYLAMHPRNGQRFDIRRRTKAAAAQKPPAERNGPETTGLEKLTSHNRSLPTASPSVHVSRCACLASGGTCSRTKYRHQSWGPRNRSSPCPHARFTAHSHFPPSPRSPEGHGPWQRDLPGSMLDYGLDTTRP